MIGQLDIYYIILILTKKRRLTAIDLSKEQALDADTKEIQQKNFTENLARNPVANTVVFFTIKEAEETILDF